MRQDVQISQDHNLQQLEREWRNIVPSRVKRLIGFDTETWKITNGVMPKAVCYTFYDLARAGNKQEPRGYILNDAQGAEHLKQLLLDDGVHIVAQNGSFDFAVASVQDKQLFALAFRAYKKGRIHCTKIRQIMLLVGDTWNAGEIDRTVALSHGAVSMASLAGMVFSYFNRDISKSKTADSWRLRYKELDGVPVQEWDTAAVDYAIEDAYWAVLVFLAQSREASSLNQKIRGADRRNGTASVFQAACEQAHAEFVLNMMAGVHGVFINDKKVAQTKEAAVKHHLALLPELLKLGVYNSVPRSARKVKLNKKRLQAVYARAMQLIGAEQDPTLFSAGAVGNINKISTAAESRLALTQGVMRVLSTKKHLITGSTLSYVELEELEVLMNIINTTTDAESSWKEISTFITAVERGKLNPDGKLRYSMNGLVATGRTSSKNPNLQNLPRGGGVRSCIEPTKGCVFIGADYSAAEFRALGEINMLESGESEIARQYQLNKSFDPHLYAAARMAEIETGETLSQEDAIAIYADKSHPRFKELKRLRQLAKIVNFGAAGGLSAPSLVSYARGYGVELTLRESETLLKNWLKVWDEMTGYFARRKAMFATNPAGDYLEENEYSRVYTYPVSNRVRFLRGYTVSCNSPFQGLVADAAKRALVQVAEECFFVKQSPLFGAVPLLFVHDEILIEMPHDGSQQSLEKLRGAAVRLGQVMEDCMNMFTPTTPAEAVPSISTLWVKDAEPLYNDEGQLLVWEPDAEEQEEDSTPAQSWASRFTAGYITAAHTIENIYNNLAGTGADDDEESDDEE